MAEFDYEKWKSDIEKLKKNRERVPEDILRTKYAKGYNRLLAEIREQTEAMTRHVLLSGFPILKGWDDPEFPEDKKDVKDLIARITSIVNLAKISGTFKKIEFAASGECDPEAAMKLAWAVHETISREAYWSYWEKHCSLQENGTIIWNDLYGMRWMYDDIWIAINGRSFRQGWPPPKALIDELKGGREKHGNKTNRI